MNLLPLLLVVLLVALGLSAGLAAVGWPRSATVLAAVVSGPVLYFLVGVLVPQATGEGRFYSFPLGGLQVHDSDILFSVAVWIAACGALLSLLLRRRDRGRG